MAKKLLKFVIPLCLLLFITLLAVGAADDFEFSVNEGEATLKKYKGKEENVTVPADYQGNPVTVIGRAAFGYNNSIVNVTLPETVTIIEDEAFRACKNLKSINIPDGVTAIGGLAFIDNSSLETVNFPSRLTSLGVTCFSRCRKLEAIHLPATLTEIGHGALAGCTAAAEITVDEENPVYYAVGNCLIRREDGVLIAGCNNSVLPQDGSITAIDDEAFMYADKLRGDVLPEGVKSVGGNTFFGCSSLTEIHFPKSFESFGEASFASLDMVHTLTVDPENPYFYAVNNCVIDRRTKTLMLGCKNSVIPDDGSVTAVGAYSFLYCHNLKQVTFPPSVVSIGRASFECCEGLTEINLPENLKTLYSYAFKNCINVKSVIFPKTTETLEEGVFFGCSGLETVTMNDGLSVIGIKTFLGCSSLKYLTLPSSCKSLGANSFSDCVSLEYVIIPTGFKTVEGSTFSGCTSLKAVRICEGLEKINSSAFGGCSTLTSVIIPSTVKTIGTMSFPGKKTVTFYTEASSPAASYAGKNSINVATPCQTHDPVILKKEEKATCLINGMTELGICKCCNCPLSVPKIIPASGHTEEETPYEVLPSCESAGLRVVHCSRCTEELYREVLPKTEHIYVNGTCVCGRHDPASMAFTDVKKNAWYEDAVRFAYCENLFSGTSATAFSPFLNMTRSMLVSVLWRMEKMPEPVSSNPFSDVKENEWYTKGVLWAAEQGIVKGNGNGFDPSGNITREQIALIVFQYAKYKGQNTEKVGNLSSYVDASAASSWAKEGLAWAVGEGLITGISSDKGMTLVPRGFATRAEVSVILMKYIQIFTTVE